MIKERIQELADAMASVNINVVAAHVLEHSVDAFRLVTDSFVVTIVGGSDTPYVVQFTQTQFTTMNPESVAHAQRRLFSLYPVLANFFAELEWDFVISEACNYVELEVAEDNTLEFKNLLVADDAERLVREDMVKANYSREAIKKLADEALAEGIKCKVLNKAQQIMASPKIAVQSQKIVGLDGKEL